MPNESDIRKQDRFITFKELKNIVPYSRTTVWRHEKAGKFPRSFFISKNKRVWSLADVNTWMETKRNGGDL